MKVKKKQQGQVMAEFVIMFALILTVVLTLVLLMAVYLEYGWRIISLVGLEYP